MNFLRSLVVACVFSVFGATGAFAQCGPTAPAGMFCGNNTGSQGLASWYKVPTGSLAPIAGGTLIGNNGTGTASPAALTNPVLGIPGTSTGQLGFAGATSGTATIAPQAAAGSATLLLPITSGTLVGSATAPLAINSTTGGISITGLAGGVLAGSGATFTISPVLGVPGASQGSLGFAGATSGTVTVQAQAAAGTATLTLPNASGTAAVNATTPLVLSATTGMLTCPTCVTSSGGGGITGTAPISVSGAGVVSINAPYTTLTASNGGIVYSGPTNLAILAGTATAGQMLQSGATAAPAWSTATWPSTTTASQLLYSSSANVVAGLATANNGVLVTNGTGAPSISTTLPSGIAATNMNLTTPTLGVATATSINKVAITAPATSATLTIANGKTLTASNTLTFTGTDGTSFAFPSTSTTVAGLGTAQTFTSSNVFSGLLTASATSVAASASGNTNLAGTLAAIPTLANTGQGTVANTTAGGLVLQGDGSTDDVRIYNKSGALVLNIPTGTTVPQLPGLASGTCSSGLATDAGNNVVKVACPGVATSIANGTTTVTSATASNYILTTGTVTGGTGTLTNVSLASLLNSLSTFQSSSALTPAGNASTTAKMAGLGSTCKITPSVTGRVRFTIEGRASNSTSGDGFSLLLVYGTGSAPANGDPISGSAPSGLTMVLITTAAGSPPTSFSLSGIVTGLTPSTQYWFDLQQAAVTGGTMTISAAACNAQEG